MTKPSTPQSTPKESYLVSHQGDTQGPFDTDFIEAMILAQVYPSSVLVQRIGTQEWVPFNSLAGFASDKWSHRQTTRNIGPEVGASSRTPNRKKSGAEVTVAWVVGVFAVLVVLWIVGQVTSSKPNTKPNQNLSSYESATTPQTSSRSTPTPSTSIAYSSNSSPAPPRDQDVTQIYRDSSGRTYRVPNSAYYHLLSLQSNLTTKKTSLDLEESQLESMSTSLDSARLHLDRTNQYSVDAYNRKVDQINSLNSRVQSKVDAYNRDVEAFNAELERVGTPIN